MEKKKMIIRALPVLIAALAILALCLLKTGTGGVSVITVKLLYDGQVEKAYELNTPEKTLADALLEAPDGQDFSTVTEIYINGESTDLSLSQIEVQDGDEYELVYPVSQLPQE